MANTQQTPAVFGPKPIKPVFCCHRVPQVGTTFNMASTHVTNTTEATIVKFTHNARNIGSKVSFIQAAMIGDPETILEEAGYLIEVQCCGKQGKEIRWFTLGYPQETLAWMEFYFEGNPPPRFIKDCKVCESFACAKCQIKYNVEFWTDPNEWALSAKIEEEHISRPEVACIAMDVHQTRNNGIEFARE